MFNEDHGETFVARLAGEMHMDLLMALGSDLTLEKDTFYLR